MFKVTIDVSRRWADDYIPATLILRGPKKLTPKEALARFKRSVGQWLANSTTGKRAWVNSYKDFNYGDFSQECVADDKNFVKFLVANGLYSAVVEKPKVEDCDEHYDVVMLPEGED